MFAKKSLNFSTIITAFYLSNKKNDDDYSYLQLLN